MTASKAYREKSVTWKSVAITGILEASEQETAEGVTKHRADNATTIQAIFIDGVGCTVTATTTDLSLRGASGYTMGANGALVLVVEQRAEGVGAVGAADKTHTYADSTLVAIRDGAPINGRGTLELTWECVDPAGAAVCVFS
jgi:hypothetical protein